MRCPTTLPNAHPQVTEAPALECAREALPLCYHVPLCFSMVVVPLLF